MAISYVYEPQYLLSGWWDDAGKTLTSWLDRDVTNQNGAIIPLDIVEMGFFDDPDAIFTPPPITVEVTASFFDDEDLFFVPAAIRALDAPDKMLKNEVIRVR